MVTLPCFPVNDMLAQDWIVLLQLKPLVVVAPVFCRQIKVMALGAAHPH